MYKSWNIDQYVKCKTTIAGIRKKKCINFSYYGVYSIVQPHSRITPARTPARARPPRHLLNLNSRRTCRSIRRPTTYSPVPVFHRHHESSSQQGAGAQGQSQIRLPTSTTPPRPQRWRHIAPQFNLQPFRRDHPPLRVVVPSSPPFSSAQAPNSVLQLRRLTPPFSVRSEPTPMTAAAPRQDNWPDRFSIRVSIGPLIASPSRPCLPLRLSTNRWRRR
jgi:hypothetical protein